MKRNTIRFLLVVVLMILSLCFLCTACGGGAGSVESAESSTISPEDNPSESLGGDVPGLNEDTLNEFGLYEGKKEANV